MQKIVLTDAMWAAFRAATGIPQDTYDVVAFARGSGKETELAELVLAGPKRATVSLMRNYLAGEPLPIIGGYVVTVDGESNPRCIWRTMELRVGPLNSVDDQFAYDEGEGDLTRERRLAAHRREYAAQAAKQNLPFDDTLEAAFERFRGRLAARTVRIVTDWQTWMSRSLATQQRSR